MFDKMITEPNISDFKHCQYGQTVLINMPRHSIYDGMDACIYRFVAYHKINNSIIVTKYKNDDDIIHYHEDEVEDACVDPDDVYAGLYHIINDMMHNYLHLNRSIYELIEKRYNMKKELLQMKKNYNEILEQSEQAKVADRLIESNAASDEFEKILYNEKYRLSQKNRDIKNTKYEVKNCHDRMDYNLKKIIKVANEFNLPINVIRRQINYTISNYSGRYYLKSHKNFCEEFIK